MERTVSETAISRAWSDLDRLASGIGPRPAGSDAERSAADYLVEAFAQRGLAARKHEFRWVGWEPVAPPTVVIHTDAGPRHLDTAAMAYTDSTPEGGVRGFLRPAGICELVPNLLEWPRFAVERAGMSAAFIAVAPGGPARPFPRPERQLLLEPIVIVGSEEFGELADQCARGEEPEVTVETRSRYVVGKTSANVIADLDGASRETIVISGHYDSVAGSPGAGDNASGVAGCLALAEHFSSRPLAKSLRFVAWGAHEFGLLGSQAYVQDLAQTGALNFVKTAVALDILSDGDRLGVWAGGDQLLNELSKAFSDRDGAFGIEVHRRGRGETDSWSFAERGIDTVMLLTLPYSHFHLASDTAENSDRELFRFSVQVASEIVERLLYRA